MVSKLIFVVGILSNFLWINIEVGAHFLQQTSANLFFSILNRCLSLLQVERAMRPRPFAGDKFNHQAILSGVFPNPLNELAPGYHRAIIIHLCAHSVNFIAHINVYSLKLNIRKIV